MLFLISPSKLNKLTFGSLQAMDKYHDKHGMGDALSSFSSYSSQTDNSGGTKIGGNFEENKEKKQSKNSTS